MREDNLIPEPVKKHPVKKFPITILVGVIIALLFTSTIALAYYSFIYKPQTTKIINVIPTITPYPSFTVFSTPISTITSIPTSKPSVPVKLNLGDVSWFSVPKLVKPLNIIANSGCVKNPSFQQTGTFADGSKLINFFYTDGCNMGEFNMLQRLIQTPNNIVYLFSNNSLQQTDDYLTNISPADITVLGLETPLTIATKFGKISHQDYSYFNTAYLSFALLKNPTFVDETKYGNIYSVYVTNKSTEFHNSFDMLTRSLYLRMKDDTIARYDIDSGFMTDNMVPKITWNDGSSNSDQFVAGPQNKCGGNGYDVLDNDSPYVQNLTTVGKTSNNLVVYQATGSNDLVKSIYANHPSFGQSNDQKELTYEEYIKAHSHLFWQDGLGDYHFLINQNYTLAAECGKPVIYLYPTKDTQVNVQVGAKITVSEPQYSAEGWTVLAHSSGQLEYQSKTYPNLFWEGTGLGQYPDISNLGFVVKQNDLIPTIKNHLFLQGLNNTEIKDFLEFWQSKLPNTPYVRLTWLTTDEMNTLAPLKVTPSPKTVIRVFLDFEGLQNKITLTPQTLTSVPRNGFTLVEWGGLLLK